MFELGVIGDEISQDFTHTLDVALELGLTYIELRSLWGKNVVDLPWDDVRKAKKLLDARGLKVSAVAGPLYKTYINGRGRPGKGATFLAGDRPEEEHLDILRRSIELALFFETPIIRTFSFWREAEPTEDVFSRIAAKLEEPLRIAAREGVTLALENEHECFAGTGAETATLLTVLSRAGHSNLKVIWDPGNAFFLGERPYPDGYENVKQQIVHVHVKDARINPKTQKPEWTPVGRGHVDFKGQLATLATDGFSGVVSLETHFVPPGGTSEEGTRESFRGLMDSLRSVGLR